MIAHNRQNQFLEKKSVHYNLRSQFKHVTITQGNKLKDAKIGNMQCNRKN